MTIDHVQVVRSESALLGEVARRLDLSAPIPFCPGWDVAALLGHIGFIHRWATVAVATGHRPEVPGVEPPPADPAGMLEYFDRGWPPLVEVLDATDPAAPGWNFAPVPQVRGFWFRRQAQETFMHRLDVEAAAGSRGPADPEVAADGIDEALEVMAPRRLAGRDGIDLGGSIHLHCTDVPRSSTDAVASGEWTFRTDDGVFRLSRGRSKGDCAVRGPAVSLLLLVWGRLLVDDPSVERFGDVTLLDRWLALDPTP